MEFKQTQIGKIPKDWGVFELSQIGGIITGTTPSTKVEEYWGKGYPFVTPTDYSGEKYVYETERTVTKHGAEKARLIPKDSIMVVCIASVGEVAMASIECITNQQINTIVCNQETDQHYVYYAMAFSKNRLKRWAGITTSPIIKKSLFEKFPLPLPPLSEQKKIAEILSTVDQGIEKVDEAIKKTQRLKNGLMQELLTKGIGHKEFKETEVGRIPKEWEVTIIKEIGEVITGTTPSTKVKEYWGKGYPFITPTDFSNSKYVHKTQRSVTREGFKEARLIPKDSVLVTCIASIGEVSMASSDCITNQQINSIVCKGGINPHYIYYTMTFRKGILRRWAGVTTSPIIKKSFFEQFPIPLPPTIEQQEIAEILNTVDKRLELLRNRKERLERTKKGLMNDLLAGRVRVKG